jgi:acetyltransferase-like isoleucine patch superfamily enzyme
MRDALKAIAHVLATIAIVPMLISFEIRAMVFGRNRALEGSTQFLSLVPGLTGQYLRRAFLARTLAGCAASATVEFGSIFSQVGARLDERTYIGPRCHLGLVHLEPDVLIAAGVHIPSGAHTHGSDTDAPIRDQPGVRRLVTIGAGSWIGSNAVILADVGRDTIVGAGAVVTRAMPDGVIAAGVPARVVRQRHPSQSASL